MDKVVPPETVEKAIGRELDLSGVDKTRKAKLANWRDATNCDP